MRIGIVCFEPLLKVTGGIGTYTRALVEALSKFGFQVTVFTKRECIDSAYCPPGIEFIPIDDELEANNVFPLQLRDSLLLLNSVKKLIEAGEEFEYIECPDYQAPGYFLVNERVSGGKMPPVFIRLHSPCFMLSDDNNEYNYDLSTLRLYAAERFAIENSSAVLYGNDAMKDRVSSYFSPEELSKISFYKSNHPTFDGVAKPIEQKADLGESRFKIGLIGRQEFRKGWDLLFRNGDIPWERVEFHFYGRDTVTYGGADMREVILSLVPENRKDQVQFAGYISQVELGLAIQSCDGFIYPSRFENHPNALLEVLPLGKPVAVSIHGGMPEILSNYPSAYFFDPFEIFDWESFLSIRGNVPFQQENTWCGEYITQTERALTDIALAGSIDDSARVSVVVPVGPDQKFLYEAVQSVIEDEHVQEIVLALDGIALENQTAFEKLPKTKIMDFPKIGPAKLRLAAARVAAGNVVQFLDADDLLRPELLHDAWRALANSNQPRITTSFFEAFGHESYVWIPSPHSPATVLFENFSHSGWATNSETIALFEAAFSDSIEHDEDWLLLIWVVLNRISITTLCAPAYLYRKVGDSRTSRNALLRFESNYKRKAYYAELLSASKPSFATLKEVIFAGHSSVAFGHTLVERVYFMLLKIFGNTIFWPPLLRLGKLVLNR